MLIGPHSDGRRWARDPGISDMIEYLRPYRHDPGALTAPVRKAIVREIQRCRASFEYAARNYFWILNKHTGDEMLFRLWDSQELILETLYMLRDKGKQQKLVILKSRQLGCSTLVEAMMLWRTAFFRNKLGLIVSVNPSHAGEVLFAGKVLYILDRLPWWLKPMEASRKIYSGLWFANPDPRLREDNLGNDSRILVQASNQTTGVGQGSTVHIGHITEVSDYKEGKAKEIIEGDLKHSLVDNPETIGVIESTGKIAGSYYHKFWQKCERLGEESHWYPCFFPWFFDKKRCHVQVPSGFQPDDDELDMRNAVLAKWVNCNACGHMRQSVYQGRSMVGADCTSCGQAKFQPLELSDGHLSWWRHEKINASEDEEDMKHLLEELCCTPEDSFQSPGKSAFPLECITYAAKCERDPEAMGGAIGYLDEAGRFHGRNPKNGKCWQTWCELNHGAERIPMSVWEFPQEGVKYYVGVDVGAGLGQDNDFSVAVVMRIGPARDSIAAVYRTNAVAPKDFAEICCQIGRMYNDAEIACEANKHDVCAVNIAEKFFYPNIYKSKDSGREHWFTTPKTKPNIFTNFVSWIRDRAIELPSANLCSEMKSFIKEDMASQTMGATGSRKDDELMATMICLYSAHADDWNEMAARNRRSRKSLRPEEAPWIMECTKCGLHWAAERADEFTECPQPDCKSIRLVGHMNQKPAPFGRLPDLDLALSSHPPASSRPVNFDDL